MIEITLNDGFVTTIDDCDADLAPLEWRAVKAKKSNKHYVYRNIGEPKNRSKELLHRIILERIIGRPLIPGKGGEYCDHIDNNPLNNRRENLRLATPLQNSQYSKSRNPMSGRRGVYPAGKRGWKACLKIDGKLCNLGFFTDPDEAYAVICEALIKHRGEFARFD